MHERGGRSLVSAASSEPVMAQRLLESNLRILATKGRLCPGTSLRPPAP